MNLGIIGNPNLTFLAKLRSSSQRKQMTTVQFRNSQRALATFGDFSGPGGRNGRKSHGLVYCGRRMNQCECGGCDGICGPNSGCPCESCRDLSKNFRQERVRALKDKPRAEFRTPLHPHPLRLDRGDNGWACDGKRLPGGCRKGCTGFSQTKGWLRFRCAECDFDLCEECLDVLPIEVHVSNSNGNMAKCGGIPAIIALLLSVPTNHSVNLGGISLPPHQIFYCGENRNQCRCGGCDGRCGPSSGCPCNSCMKLTVDLFRSLAATVGAPAAAPTQQPRPATPHATVPYVENRRYRVTCHPHSVRTMPWPVSQGQENGWKCDGSRLPGGCKKGCTDFNQTTGWKEYRCADCDFDLCEGCLVAYLHPDEAPAVAQTGRTVAPVPVPAPSPTPAPPPVRPPSGRLSPLPARPTQPQPNVVYGPAETPDGIPDIAIASASTVDGGTAIIICVVGPSKSGKSALVHRHRTGQAPSPTSSLTSDVESFATQWNDGRAVHRFQFRDIGGRPFLRHLRQPNYEVADGALCVFDATSEESFNELQGMVAEFRRMAKPGAVMVIAANKCDGAASSTLLQRVEQWRVGLEPPGSVRLCRTSATTGNGVQTAFSLVQEQAVANRGVSSTTTSAGSNTPATAATPAHPLHVPGDNVNAGKQSDRVVAQLRSELTAAQQRIRELEAVCTRTTDELQRLKGAKPLQSWEEAQSVETQLQEALTSVSRQKAQLWTRAREGTACVVCQTEEKTVLLLPCRHLCLCEGCSPSVRDCPMCRSAITSRMNVFA